MTLPLRSASADLASPSPPGGENTDEVAWAIAIRAGDTARFDALFDAMYEPLCRVADRYVRSLAVAEELVQDAFLALWRRRDALDPAQSLRLYLLQSVRHRALNYLRHERVADEWHATGGALAAQRTAPAVDVELNRAELVAGIAREVDRLPRRGREIFLLSRERGLSYAEIARHCGISVKTVETQMARALRTLRTRLGDLISRDLS